MQLIDQTARLYHIISHNRSIFTTTTRKYITVITFFSSCDVTVTGRFFDQKRKYIACFILIASFQYDGMTYSAYSPPYLSKVGKRWQEMLALYLYLMYQIICHIQYMITVYLTHISFTSRFQLDVLSRMDVRTAHRLRYLTTATTVIV